MSYLIFFFLPVTWQLSAHGRIINTTCPPGRTFFTGEVGVVTWLVGLVGDDTVTVVGVGAVLLLTDAEGLLLSGRVKKKKY